MTQRKQENTRAPLPSYITAAVHIHVASHVQHHKRLILIGCGSALTMNAGGQEAIAGSCLLLLGLDYNLIVIYILLLLIWLTGRDGCYRAAR